MSTEAAMAFAERLKSDEAFRSRLTGAASREERLTLAAEEGFDLKAGDLATVKQALGIGELSEADLERIAGGSGTTSDVLTSATYSVIGAGAAVGAAAAAL